MPIPKEQVELALARAFLRGGALRDEDRQKATELRALLEEMARALPTASALRRRRRAPFTVVDACAGKSAAGALFVALVAAPRGVATSAAVEVVALDRDRARLAHAREGASALGVAESMRFVEGDADDASLWPTEPDLVVALHACGGASDAVIDRAIAARARRVLVVPCCYGAGARAHDGGASRVAAQPIADTWASALALPRHAPVRRRFSQAVIDAERTLRLEAAGYETEVVELFPPTVSPFSLLWRARRVGEPVRSREAADALATLRADLKANRDR